jgi:hypothetical protein
MESTPSNGSLNPGLTVIVRAAMYAVAAFSIASTIAAVNEIGAFDRLLESSTGVEAADLAAAERVSETFVGLAFWVGIAAGGVTIVWWYRARQAVGAESDLRWSPGWAIGGWFIPLANAVIPKLVLNEIDRVGRARHDGVADWRSVPTTPVANVWWAAWVGGVVLSLIGATVVGGEAVALDFDAARYRSGLVVSALGFGVSALAGFLGAAAIRVVGSRVHG